MTPCRRSKLLASTGGDVSDVIDLDEFLIGLIERDSGRVLTAMGHAVNLGRDPRTITEELVRHLRNAFLSLLAPELVMLPSDRIDTIADQAQQLGAAAIVRAIERLGSALVDMRHAPDPRILVEVALVQLTHDGTGTDADALVARIERLETTVKQLKVQGAGSASAVPKDPATGRAVLGGAARRPERAERADIRSDDQPHAEASAETPPPASTAPATSSSDEPVPAAVSVPDAWEQTVKSQVKPLVRALYSAGSFVGNRGDTWLFSVPNEAHGSKCDEHRTDVEAALSKVIGSDVTIEFVSGGSPIADAEPPAAAAAPATPPAQPLPTATAPERSAAAPTSSAWPTASPSPSRRHMCPRPTRTSTCTS